MIFAFFLLTLFNFSFFIKDLGSLQFTIEYIPTLMQIKIHLISATSLPARDSNGLSDPYVKLHLLPGIAKVSRLLSRITEESIRSI
jgi:hypothetical protein